MRQHKILVLAESCTGGGIAESVTAVPGSTAWFDRAYVVYSNQAKQEMLGVSADVLSQYGAVSQETAMQMATGALTQSTTAHIALSVTGIAGPGGGSADKPVGTVWFGLAERDGRCTARLQQLTSGRQHIRLMSMQFALKWLLEVLSA